MAATTTAANNKLVVYQKQIIKEYIRENLFSPYIGTAATSIIRIINDLKKGGEQINVPLVARLKARAVGVGAMVGNEEVIDNYGFRLWIDWARNAIKINNAEEHKSSIDIFGEAKPLLSDWGKELLRDETIDALFAIVFEGAPAGLGSTYGQRVNGILFDSASVAQRNVWHADNADRFMFGGSQGNYVAGNFAASCANVTPSMILSAAMIRKMKRQAKKASPRIRPYMTKDSNKEYFVVFCGSNAFRDLQGDPEIVAADIGARPREGNGMDKNPLFQDGDLLHRGVIIREIPELDIRVPAFYATAGSVVNGVGTSISPVFMMGQSAMAQCWGQMPTPTFLKEDDYGFVRGAGIKMAYGLGKIAKKTPAGNLKEWGVFTAFVASQPDQ
jgi:hypothetical protein